jgi:hypothetical protein
MGLFCDFLVRPCGSRRAAPGAPGSLVDAAQDAYARFGFVKARPEQLVLRPID